MERAAQGPRALSLTASMVQQGDQNENWDRDADQPEQNIAHDVPPIGSGVGVSLIGAPTAPTAIPHSVPQLAALYGCKTCRKGANEHGSGEPERELGSGPRAASSACRADTTTSSTRFSASAWLSPVRAATSFAR